MVIPRTIAYAHRLFEQITEPDHFMWNTMIRGSSHSSDPLKAISLYIKMDRTVVRPDNFTFPFILKACTKLSWLKMGKEIHGKILKFGLGGNTIVRNTLIYFHANCGDLEIARMIFEDGLGMRDVVAWSSLTAGYAKRGELVMARRLFDGMPVKDLVSWNVMITGYVKSGEMDSARKLFDQVPERDVVTWNAMIAGYAHCGLHEQAFEMFEEMRLLGERPDAVTLLCLLSSCADSGALDEGERIHCSLMEMGLSNLNVIFGNALIDLYSKCGRIERALEVFKEMRDKDISSWNSLIGGFAFHGHANESISLFEEMRRGKIKPDEITFVGVLVACSHGGMVHEGQRYFNSMRQEYGIEPNIKHYGCMVDILGRAGLLEEAFEFIEGMDIKPNPIIWRTLLGACKIQGNAELGKRANDQLLTMRQDQSGDYVLLANIYASTGEWDGVEKVRKMMDDSGVIKAAGCSQIGPDNKELMHFLLDTKPKLNSKANTF
ncbi:hypothetical protein GIB67_011967 [Kingdonia uniflora]|uniref:Pentatricopeptide repeat-containing protein n=1 Tax=Kingdonia uniflora TaxID=39325 RepID=A0A7J7M030_9MAGN|nr:hypothetical protein GIB67_011967 [Kingdonia uniflora]